jgi:prepilin-type N-terminal cleavage/methylation domain-containing protein
MESMNSQQKPGIMAKLRNSKGFSLIEMAIVLVIIGIIIAAIVKGQDLMINSRAKQLISTANSWKIATMAYLDRNGRYPGDSGKNGLINDTETTPDAISEMESGNMTLPANPVLVGGSAFWFYLGNVHSGTNQKVNIIAICSTVNCGTAFTDDELALMKAVDTALDGGADEGVGNFRSAKTAITVASSSTTGGGRADGYINDTGTVSILSAVWPSATAATAAYWAFDKPF